MHNIEYYDYKENVDKKEVYADLNEYVEHQTWAEGGSGLETIRWNNHVCGSYSEAKEWITKNDRGWYDQLAVKYLSPVSKKSKKADELALKVKETFDAYNKKNNELYVKTRTSEFIGCSSCKSRLAAKYLKGNFCPICRADLRSDTILKSISAAKKRWENAQKTFDEYIQNHSEKETRWLVKIEYHT